MKTYGVHLIGLIDFMIEDETAREYPHEYLQSQVNAQGVQQ